MSYVRVELLRYRVDFRISSRRVFHVVSAIYRKSCFSLVFIKNLINDKSKHTFFFTIGGVWISM